MASREANWAGFGRRTRAGGRGSLWPAMLAVTTAATVLVAVALSVAVAGYVGRSARDGARAPQFTDGSAGDARLLWRETHDSVGTHDATVITIEPLVADAPLPPGLTRWPEPGQAVLSPELARIGAHEGVESRYGTAVGLIGAEGLASREELLVYVRPRTGTVVADDLFPAAGFGGAAFGIGESADVPPLWRLLLAMTVVLVVPTVLLVVIVTRTGLVERQRQALVLDLLGAGRRERWGWAWGAVGRPWLAGMAVAGVAVGLVMARDVQLPGRNYTVQAADVRESAGLVVTLALLAGTAVLVAAVVAGRPRPAAYATRPRAQLPTWPVWAALVCVLAAPVATAALWLSGRTGAVVAFIVYFAAVIVTFWSLPHLVGRVTVGVADHGRLDP